MLVRLLSLLFVLLSVLPPSADAAPLLGDTAVPFQAERTVIWKGRTYTGRMMAVPGRQRHEQEIKGFHPILILRADRRMAYLLLPEFQLYAAFEFPDSVSLEGGIDRLGPPEGLDVIDGHNARRYRLHRDGRDGSVAEGHGWIDAAGILVKVDGTILRPGHPPEPGTIELSHIVPGPQDPALFEIPPGYTLVQNDVLAGLLTLRMPTSH